MAAPTSKRCPKCSVTRPVDKWNKHSGRPDGLAIWCKPCMKDYRREYSQRPEVKRRAAEKALERYHRLSRDEKLRLQERSYQRGRHLLAKYGLTVEAYEQMLVEQGGGCAICEKPAPEGRRLSVDHDHACCPGEKTCGLCVRGLLCITCNVWLGFYENRDWVARADEYLQREIENPKKRLT